MKKKLQKYIKGVLLVLLVVTVAPTQLRAQWANPGFNEITVRPAIINVGDIDEIGFFVSNYGGGSDIAPNSLDIALSMPPEVDFVGYSADSDPNFSEVSKFIDESGTTVHLRLNTTLWDATGLWVKLLVRAKTVTTPLATVFGNMSYLGGMNTTIGRPNASQGNMLINDNHISASMTINPGVLPLKLLSFAATKQSSSSGLLNSTVSEQTNTASFIVERSTDGEHYTVIGTVAAAGNYTAAKAYSYTDKTPADGLNYYRLKMTDIDGKYTYSMVKTLQFDATAVGLQIMPNPVQSTFYIKGLAKPAIVRIVDINGKYLLVQNGVTATTPLNVSSLASAVYLVQVMQDGQLSGTYKLVKE